jgi:hypothetical protein
MWGPFLFGRPRRFGCLCPLEPLRQRIDPGAQRENLLLLPIDHVAQFDVGALQERYFRFDPLDCIAVHFDSVTRRGPPKSIAHRRRIITTKLEVFLYRQPASKCVPKPGLRRRIRVKCLFL